MLKAIYQSGEKLAQKLGTATEKLLTALDVPLSAKQKKLVTSTAGLALGCAFMLGGGLSFALTPVILCIAVAKGLTLTGASVCAVGALMASYGAMATLGKGLFDRSEKQGGFFKALKAAALAEQPENSHAAVIAAPPVPFTSQADNAHQFQVEQNLLSSLFSNSGQHADTDDQKVTPHQQQPQRTKQHGK
ncbi:MAG: hypothetical protein EP349_02415 [Alphaproteobacteria bacterium]|nr:MAG: hypothetical protein EP349_02415 [Alphaproteobacteria bacterium]